jgi:hypothetical protein
MLDKEQARQLGCVVKRFEILMEEKVKGSVLIHLDGGGNIGSQWSENLIQLRDKYSSEKRGIPLEEDEFIALMTKQ